MTIIGTDLERACKGLLQRNICLEVKNKCLRKGKLILFYQKNFHIIFVIDTIKNGRDKIELPIPYGIELHPEDGLIYFDYRIDTLSKFCDNIELFFRFFPKKKMSKFWDSILTIESK